MTDLATLWWMIGLLLAVGATTLALAGPVWAAAAVGAVMTLEGVAADLLATKGKR